jgi:hypothetical protein
MSLSHEEAIRGAKSAIEEACLCLLDADEGNWLGVMYDLRSIEAKLDDELYRLGEEDEE